MVMMRLWHVFFKPISKQVTWLRYWYGVGLATYRSQVPVLAGHHCVVVLGKLLTAALCLCHQAVYNLVPAKGVISLAEKVTAGLAWWNVTTAYHRVYE